jgi:hypothetical protein
LRNNCIEAFNRNVKQGALKRVNKCSMRKDLTIVDTQSKDFLKMKELIASNMMAATASCYS